MAFLAPIAGAAVGALISRGGSKGSSTSTQQAEPWSGAQPGLRELYASALQNFQGQGPQYYAGRTVAAPSQQTLFAQDRTANRATQGSPLNRTAQQQAQQTLQGGYLSNPSTSGLNAFGANNYVNQNAPGIGGLMSTAGGSMLNANPYVDQMFGQASKAVGEQFSKNVMPGIASAFSGAGRFGSNQMAEGMGQAAGRYGDTLNSLATSIYGGNYANERSQQQQAQSMLGQFGLAGRGQQISALSDLGSQFGRERVMQSQAMNQAPQLAQSDYFDLGQLANVGAARDQYAQQITDADKARWDFNQNAPNAELEFFSRIMQNSPMGSSGSTSSNQGGNPLMGMLGGAQLGQSIFSGMNAGRPVSGFNNGAFGAGVNPYSGEFMGSLEF